MFMNSKITDYAQFKMKKKMFLQDEVNQKCLPPLSIGKDLSFNAWLKVSD